MERVTLDDRSTPRPVLPPPPAGSLASEDGGQRGLNDKNEVKLSDNPPAGRSGYPTEESYDLGVSAQRERLTAHLDVRLSRSEHGEISQRARALGVKPSAWARAVMYDALDSRRSEVQRIERMAARPRRDHLVDGTKVETLRRIGTTFEGLRRDIARARKDGEPTTIVVDETLISRACSVMAELRTDLGDRTRL